MDIWMQHEIELNVFFFLVSIFFFALRMWFCEKFFIFVNIKFEAYFLINQ
jgi:hypothetical protein